jgi:hypothetical protein
MKLSFRRLITTAVVAAALVPFASSVSASALPAATPTPGAYRFFSGFHQQCLGGRSDHVVSLAECQFSFADQVWVMEALPLAGYYRFRNQLRNQCLAFPSGANGSEARISSCVDSFNDQWWTFLNTIPASDSVLLRNHKTGKCLVDRTANGRATESDCVLNFRDQWWAFFAA